VLLPYNRAVQATTPALREPENKGETIRTIELPGTSAQFNCLTLVIFISSQFPGNPSSCESFRVGFKMRLLNAKTLKLYSFQEGEAPRYAILSHTWHDDEVLFGDLQNISRASKKAGFAKIKFCCGQALKEDIKFVWVDTCCINKTSSAELSEAINSMYRWYQKARICYVYLRDVSMPEDGEVDIRGSLWFKRA
jgi:hypothetical protein